MVMKYSSWCIFMELSACFSLLSDSWFPVGPERLPPPPPIDLENPPFVTVKQPTKLDRFYFRRSHQIHKNEWFIEDQTFLRSKDSAPSPPPSPLSRLQDVSLSQSSCVLSDGRGRQGGGRGAELFDGEKIWPSLNHSILSDLYHCIPSDLWRKKYSS